MKQRRLRNENLLLFEGRKRSAGKGESDQKSGSGERNLRLTKYKAIPVPNPERKGWYLGVNESSKVSLRAQGNDQRIGTKGTLHAST